MIHKEIKTREVQGKACDPLRSSSYKRELRRHVMHDLDGYNGWSAGVRNDDNKLEVVVQMYKFFVRVSKELVKLDTLHLGSGPGLGGMEMLRRSGAAFFIVIETCNYLQQ